MRLINFIFILLLINGNVHSQIKFFKGYWGKSGITAPKVIGKVGLFTSYALSGIAHGFGEAQYADNYVFEKAFGVGPYDFGGSQEWQRQYEGNRYLNSNGDINPHKQPEFLNFTRDAHHALNVADWYLGISATITIGIQDRKIKHKLFDVATGILIRGLFSHYSYKYLRNKAK